MVKLITDDMPLIKEEEKVRILHQLKQNTSAKRNEVYWTKYNTKRKREDS